MIRLRAIGMLLAALMAAAPVVLPGPAGAGNSSQIVYLGGDGSSMAQAILIHGAAGERDGIASEYDWIARNRPGWQPRDQALLSASGRFYDALTIAKGGQTQVIYFDISEYFGKP